MLYNVFSSAFYRSEQRFYSPEVSRLLSLNYILPFWEIPLPETNSWS